MRVAVSICCLLLAACAPLVETPDGRRLRATSDDFRAYAESVFRRHNAAATAIIDAIDMDAEQGGVDTAALDEADRRMMTGCEPLNRLAVARRDGRELELADLRGIAKSVPACDRATRQAERLLDSGI